MSLALYRKYRPRTFAEVIGQDHVTEPLAAALRSGRLHHAYLFSGPRGCGKTSSARILARSLNCAQGPTPDPCGRCDSCVSLALDGPGSIDVIEIDAASHGGVDDARELRERAFFAPMASRFKVYVIDEAHMVSTQGFNALLKLVEEPPDYVKFVFATTEPEKVLGTIKSRTHHYPFRLVPPAVLRPYLEKLCALEDVAVEPAVFPLVVRSGGGSVRDTLSVLDQLIAGAGPDGVGYRRAVALLGVTDVALIDDMVDALAAGDGAAVFATVEAVAGAGHDARRFAADLLGRLRDLIVLQQIPDAATKGLLDSPDDELTRMTTQAQQFGPATLSRCADLLHDGLTEMRGTTGPRLLLELICARMLLPGADESVAGLLQRMERMERRVTLSESVAVPLPDPGVRPEPVPPREAAPARRTAPEPTSGPVVERTPPAADHKAVAEPATPAPVSRPAPGALDATAVRRVWEDILGLVRRKSQRVAAVAREAVVRDVHDDTLVLMFKHQVHATMLSDHASVLLEAVHEVLGGDWQLRCEIGGGPSQPALPVEAVAAAPSRAAQTTAIGAADSAAASLEGKADGGGSGTSRANGSERSASSGAAGGGSRANDHATTTPANPAGVGGDALAATDDDWPEIAQLGRGAEEPSAVAAIDGPGTRRSTATRAAKKVAPAARAGDDMIGQASTKPVPADRATGEQSSADKAAVKPSTTDGGAKPSPADGAAVEPSTTDEAVAKPSTTDEAVAKPRPAEQAATKRSTAGRGAAKPSPAERAAANAARASAKRGGRPATATAVWGDGPLDEPPFDPEFDGPAGRAGFTDFDPGDEPADDDGAPATRQSSEQQALELLRNALGAEKIGESGH